MDFSTILGILAGLTVIGISIMLALPSGKPEQAMFFLDLPSVFCTVGGTICAVLVNFPLKDVFSMVRVVGHAFMTKPVAPLALIDTLRRYAEIARRDGILALENVSDAFGDDFLQRGIQLAVDGTDPELIQTMMNTELAVIEERHERGKSILEAFARYFPAFGMIGTLLGLVIMMGNLTDPSSLGSGMAVALITTFYGAIGAYLICGPMAEKLGIRNQEEALVKRMIIRGVMAIQSGDNPRIVEQKLKIFLPPSLRR